MSLTIKTEFIRSNGEAEIRRTRLTDGTDRHVQLINFVDATYGALYGLSRNSYVFSYVDPDGDLCSINSDAELLECCRCAAEQGKTAKVQVKVVDDVSMSSSSISQSSQSTTSLNLSRSASQVSQADVITPSVESAAPSVDVDSDSEYVQVNASRPVSPSAPAEEIKPIEPEPIKPEPAFEAVTEVKSPVTSVTVEDVTEEDKEENALVEAIMASLTTQDVKPVAPAPSVTGQKPNVAPSVFTTVTSNVTEVKDQPSKVDASPKPTSVSQSNTSASNPAIHRGIICDGCEVGPIVGDRYSCTICVDFDLCSKCEQSGQSFGRHSAKHNMIKHSEPVSHRPCGPCPVFNPPPTSTPASGPSDVHAGVKCDGCGVVPITGTRYKCTACPNFDLCEKCEAKNEHDPKHVLLKMRHQLTGEDVQNAIMNRVSHWWRRGPAHGHGFGGHHGHHGHGFGRFGGGRWGGRCGRRDGPEDANRPRASFIGDVTVQDGATVAPGSTFQKVWSVQNTGDKAWPEGCKLVFVGGDLTSADQAGSAVEHSVNSVPVTAQPGEIVNIKIDIQAPAEEGRFRSTFRLVDANGEKFGPRFWIDVNVAGAASSSSSSTSASASTESCPAQTAEQDPVRAAVESFLSSLNQQGGSSPLASLIGSLGGQGGIEKLLGNGPGLGALLGALNGQNNGNSPLQPFLDALQARASAPNPAAAPSAPAPSAPTAPSAPSAPVAEPVVEPFRYQAELDSIREMQLDVSDETVKRLLIRYNGSVPRTVAQIFEM